MPQNYGIIPIFRSTQISPLSRTLPAVHYIFFVPPFGETKKDAASIGARMKGTYFFWRLKRNLKNEIDIFHVFRIFNVTKLSLMKKGERLINTARDKFSNNLLHAVELFDNNKTESFRVRKDFNEQKINPVCVECGQDLTISPSIYDRLFFRHLPNHNYCLLSSNSLTPQQQREYFEIIKSRESLRHLELKNKIGNLLTQINEVDKNSIFIDNKYIIKNGERRKPDVYCKIGQVEIVFEIQLSKLPLWYILNRYNFYKENNIYLIWILDNFDVKNPDSFTRDIKYLNKYQNY